MNRDGVVAGALVAFISALLFTIVIAWPVVRAPSTQIFGTEIDGRHHDPFTVMWQFDHGGPPAPYRQPLVDDAGSVLARMMGPVAAFNVIVLLSFPLTAAFTYLLGRYLKLSNGGAMIAGMAFAFAPIHLAHAAYHPHIAQTQWIPLYFLALWACASSTTVRRLALLVAAAAALTLANLYAAFTCAVLTPVALVFPADRGFCATSTAPSRRSGRPMFALLCASGVLFVAVAIRTAFPDFSRLGFADADAMRFGARWWAYIVPPVDDLAFGPAARRLWHSAGMTGAVLEQQLYVSPALLALACIGVWSRMQLRRLPAGTDERLRSALRAVPTLLIVAAAAALCSLALPYGQAWPTPASMLHAGFPMFRSYARFGIVTHLMIALLAAVGVMRLFSYRRGVASAERKHAAAMPMQILGPALVVLVVVQYVPLPWRSRDVLPTLAHRWLAGQPGEIRALDCVPQSPDVALVPWLMRPDPHKRESTNAREGRLEVTFVSDYSPRCDSEPAELAAFGFTHIIVRRASPLRTFNPSAMRGLTLEHSFEDAHVFRVPRTMAPFVTLDASGFYGIEREHHRTWRWMGQRSAWLVRNTTDAEIPLIADVELAAFAHPRQLLFTVGNERLAEIRVTPERRWYRLGPVRLAPGDHHVLLSASEPATIADGVIHNGDRRALTIMVGERRWAIAPPTRGVAAAR